jgi:hypothetical protein
LAVAELSRRGLLLPDKLETVVPNMIKALHFDKLKGSCGVGIHIRDAACYVCWAFARAYTPTIMKKYIKELLMQLLIVSLFDREINCRRAANAAFQENIGRQGHDQFEFGLSIISIADFFSISNRSHTYLQLSKTIASLHEHYYQSFLEYLLNNRIKHWDEDIRILGAKAISQLLRIESFTVYSKDATNMEDYTLQFHDYRSELCCLNMLLSNCTSDNLNERHGSIIGSGWCIYVLSQKGVKLGQDSLKLIEDVVPTLDKKRLYRGRGGEIVRKAVNFFIEMVSRTYVQTSVKLRFTFVELLNEHLKHPQSSVQVTAIQALRQLIFQYFSRIPATIDGRDENSLTTQQQSVLTKLVTSTVQKYTSYLESKFSSKNEENVAIFRGYTRALGIMPLNVLCATVGEKYILHKILDLLEEFSSMNKTIAGEYDAETARNCVSSFGEIFHKLFPLILQIPSTIESINTDTAHYYIERFQKFIHITSYDYSVDKRGDTGSWTRIEALLGIFHFLQVYSDYSKLPYVNSSGSTSLEFFREEFLVGRRVMTAYGVGEILRAKYNNLDGKEQYSLWVQFRSESLGDLQAQEENWNSEFLQRNITGVLYFVFDIATLRSSLLQLTETATVNIAPEVLSSFVESVLKQLAEKLDCVREVAGMILVKLVTEFKTVAIPDGDIIFECIHAFAVTLCGPDAVSFNVINWSQPDHVYPILVNIMRRSRLYFHAIFCGYIISIGDITETITKKSTQVLLKQLASERQMCESAFTEFQSMFACINISFEKILEIHMPSATDKSHNKLEIPYNVNYHDRIMHSFMKTLDILLKNGYYESFYRYFSGFPDATDRKDAYHRNLILYYEKIMIELRSCTSIPKLQLGIEILSAFLSNDYQGTLRKRAMTSLILFLAHRFPRIRKCKCLNRFVPLF